MTQPNVSARQPVASSGINAVFALACGCTLDGCHDSDPGRKWAAGVRDGALYCVTHRSWQRLVDVVSLAPLEALSNPSSSDGGSDG